MEIETPIELEITEDREPIDIELTGDTDEDDSSNA